MNIPEEAVEAGGYIPASQLDSSHIGKTVRVTLGKAQAEDVLVSVTHHSASTDTTPRLGPSRWEPGRIGTTITFQQLGEVECGHSQKVRIIE